ncbi:Stage V sporulation protein D [Eubacteriaceae bacterium CHKCI004]|nr:Stage V sporulation protein D [Eubacteriaceae bacterium CHKCI004]
MFKNNLKIDGNKVKKQLKAIVSNRVIIIGIFVLFLFCLLVYRLFVLQIVEGQEHLDSFNYKVERTIETSGSRGNIYDCNGKLLAYNQLAYSVTLETTDRTEEIAQERSKQENRDVSENEVRNEVIYNLIQLLEANGDEIQYDLPLEVNGKGKLVFTESGSALRRFKQDIYGITNVDNLTGDEKEQAEKWLNSSPEEVYEYLRMGTDGPTGSGRMFEISDSYSMEDTLKIMSVRYDLYMNRYSQTTPITVASNISSESIAAISEREDEFPGVEIKTDSLRKYNDAKYMAGIIGYTGVISEDELNEYNSAGGDYEASDVVGKTGIEKTMETTLQGKKGTQKVLVDNLGKIIQEVDSTEATAGNDVYLTIDLDLQKYAYNILERRLAGIVLAHLTTADDAGDSKMIPIKDVYFALIDNNIIDITNLNRKKAEQNEKEVYQIYQNKQKSVMQTLRRELSSGTTSRGDLNEERREYVDYIYDMLVDSEILSSSLMDENDETYQNWEEESISLKTFLQHAINSEWVDISALDIASDYYSSDEIYNELIDYIINALQSDEAFDKILYKYMIKNEELSGKRVCMLLYDQGVLDKNKDEDYNALRTDQMSAYTFMYEKIRKIEITPAQLALDPCSGSVIITDPKTGDVRAMVSYPSYNNNRLANGIDSDYYASLNSDKSSPMLNRATQTRTAPGSTFKPVSATASLEEGIIDGNDYVRCVGIFEDISPSPRCWIYPSAHGSLNVSGAIAVSCNYFFYQMGYNLGTTNGVYSSETGLQKLAKYAAYYGLDRKSGVEITEYEPQISDEDAVRSAIGQGTHSYAPIQISRYVTSLVNEDNLLGLTLLDKTTDTEGNVLTTYDTKVEDKLDVADETFNLIKQGMRDVVNGKDSSIRFLYEKQDLKVAGKTGTAQENTERPNHALFISYAPYDDPEITMTVVVPNGYTSTNAAEIARDIYKYYFNKTSEEEEKATTALMPSGGDSNND